MTHAKVDLLDRMARPLVLVVLVCSLAAAIGCGGALTGSNHNRNGDPLHLGVHPGPLGSTEPQTLEVRIGSEPSERIVSLSLTINSLQAVNSGSENLELLHAPITVEFTRSSIITEPVLIRSDIYQDTYSTLILPDMAGQLVFYDSNGVLSSQSLNLPGRTIVIDSNLVLGATPEVLSASLDLAETFNLDINPVTVNPIVITTSSIAPVPSVAPEIGQPETGSISFLVGTVTAVDTTQKVISMQPSSGDAMQLSYDNATQFINCDPTILTGMMIETEDATLSDGSVLASRIALIEHSASSSELYGLLAGHAPDGASYNLVLEGGAGLNVSPALIGKNITVDWIAASYSVNTARIDMNWSDDLVFDEARTFPGQFVAVQWDSLIVPDPDSDNSGYIQPRMIELQEQTICGQVSNYVFDPGTQTGTFTLMVADTAPIKRLNSGLLSITVRQTAQTYLRNSPRFNNGDSVKVRGLVFADPNFNNGNYQPPDPIAFIIVADRISK